MDFLWTPWRYRYVTQAEPSDGCVFCAAAASSDDRATLIVHRAAHHFVILNRFPYSNGHMMVVPYRHVAALDDLESASLGEMMALAQLSARHLTRLYGPDGMNLGMNLGMAAGAGIASHLHLHVLPRWFGDTNFMTAVGETRVLPENLETTWERLRAAFAGE